MASFPNHLALDAGFYAVSVSHLNGTHYSHISDWASQEVKAVVMGNNPALPLTADIPGIIHGHRDGKYLLSILDGLVSNPTSNLFRSLFDEPWSRSRGVLLFVNGSARQGVTANPSTFDKIGLVPFFENALDNAKMIAIGGAAQNVCKRRAASLKGQFSKAFAFSHPARGHFGHQVALIQAQLRANSAPTAIVNLW